MRTFPFIITILGLWIILVATLYLAFGLTFPTVFVAILSIGGVTVAIFTYRYYGWPFAERDSYDDIKAADLYTMIEKGEKFEIFDVRSPTEYGRGHLPKSVNMPFSRIGRGRTISGRAVFVSGRGIRSRIVIRRVRGKQLFNLREGFESWTEEHLPVER